MQDTRDNNKMAPIRTSPVGIAVLLPRDVMLYETRLARLLFFLSLASFGHGSLAGVLAGSPLFRRLLGPGICSLFELVGLPL